MENERTKVSILLSEYARLVAIEERLHVIEKLINSNKNCDCEYIPKDILKDILEEC